MQAISRRKNLIKQQFGSYLFGVIFDPKKYYRKAENENGNENKKALLKKLQLATDKEATPASKNVVVEQSRRKKIKFNSQVA